MEDENCWQRLYSRCLTARSPISRCPRRAYSSRARETARCGIAVSIFVNEARRCVPYPVGTKKGGGVNLLAAPLFKMPFTRRLSASLPSETKAPSLVCGKNQHICCRHLFDEFDPKHHVQRYVRDPQATPHSISKACKNKEQCIAVCALHLNAV